MTIEALGHKSGRRNKDAASEALPIGETDSNIFNCPACARPLGVGAPRCPGCGVRLIAGVQAGRALGFVGVGLVVGLLVGGGVMAGAAALTRVEPVAAVDGGTTTLPTAAPLATAAPVVTPAPIIAPAVPTAALSALRQTALVNQRIATDAALLMTTLAAAEPSTADIARALRSMSSNATFGQRIAADIGDWSAGTMVAADLGAFYTAIRSTASEGLGASLRNDAAYLAAAAAMVAVIDSLPDLDAAARSLAADADIDLPVVDLPAVVPADPAPAASGDPVTP
jgi:hypothetical protein